MTKTGHTLSEFPAGWLSWRDIIDFIQYLGHDSALRAEMSPETAHWEGSKRLPMLIAQLIDEIEAERYEFAVANTPKNKPKPKKPQPYPRPGVKSDTQTKTYGHDAIPVKEFAAWWDSQETDADSQQGMTGGSTPEEVDNG